MGDSSGGARDWERERLMMSEVGSDTSFSYQPSSLSPDFDHQQSSITLLKAQLKLVTQERDHLKKDLKKVSQERDGAIRHISLSTSPQSSLDNTQHHRTNSDTAPSSSSKLGKSPALTFLNNFIFMKWNTLNNDLIYILIVPLFQCSLKLSL